MMLKTIYLLSDMIAKISVASNLLLLELPILGVYLWCNFEKNEKRKKNKRKGKERKKERIEKSGLWKS